MEYEDLKGQLFKRNITQGLKRAGPSVLRRGAGKGRAPTPPQKGHSEAGCERDLGFTRSPAIFTPLVPSPCPPGWPPMGQLPREEKQGCLSNSQEAGGTLSCLSPRRRGTHTLTGSHLAQPLYLLPESETLKGGPAARCINLLLASPLLLTAGANWPFSSSREHRAPRRTRLGSRHLTPCVIHKTRASQGWRLRGVWPRLLCVV